MVKKRILHYDLLRILAAFSVVMLHSAAQFWYSLDVYSTEWIVANSYDAVFRFGVPVFVMISGAIFLDQANVLDVKRLYFHNILRMAVIYVVWSCIYGIWDCRYYDLKALGIKPLLLEILGGRYHLWFLPMIIGIYMLLPILKEWVVHAEKKTIQYFLILFVVIQIGGETLRALTVTDELHYLIDLVKIDMVCGYIGYFVLGYYLAHVGVSEKMTKLCYALAIPSAVCNILIGNYLAHRHGMAVGTIYDSFGMFTFFIVTALFLFAHKRLSRISFGNKSAKIIQELSASTLGVYMLHVGLIEWLETQGIHTMLISNIVGIPLYAVGCFVVCSIAAALIRRIPLIGRYLC